MRIQSLGILDITIDTARLVRVALFIVFIRECFRLEKAFS